MYYIGIDPGKNGAFALLDHKGGLYCVDFDKSDFLSTMKAVSVAPYKAICCIEKVHSMPQQGVKSMFSMGENFGWLQGVLDAYRIPWQAIAPQKWKKEFGLNSDKAKSVEVCRQLFPDAALIPPNCHKPHDGIAEAVLMAEYARRKLTIPDPDFDVEHWD